MGFFDRFKRKKENEVKYKLLGDIKALILLCNNLLVKLDKRSTRTIDEGLQLRVNKFRENIKDTLHHLDEAYGYLDVLNTEFTIKELVEANKAINFQYLDDNLDVLIKIDRKSVNEYRFTKKDKDDIQFIRTNTLKLITTLPRFNLKL